MGKCLFSIQNVEYKPLFTGRPSGIIVGRQVQAPLFLALRLSSRVLHYLVGTCMLSDNFLLPTAYSCVAALLFMYLRKWYLWLRLFFL